MYYILLRGFSEPAENTPVEIVAQLLPLVITDVHADAGGDGKFVTTTIEGAQFHETATVQLLRPGSSAAFAPVSYEVIDATKIIAQFDFTDAPHGLYDLKVINPNGDEAVVPYRFLVQRAIEPEVTIGVGGPRIILAGDVGTYSVALQSLSNLDTPYTFFEIGIPEMGHNQVVRAADYVAFYTNLQSAPEEGGLADLPWADLNSVVNTNGYNLASGYLLDHPADGFTGVTFNVATYRYMELLHDKEFEELRAQLYSEFPEHAKVGTLDGGPERLDEVWQQMSILGGGMYSAYVDPTYPNPPEDLPPETPFLPFEFHVVAAATSLTRDEFIEHAVSEADRLRTAILDDQTASASLVALAADPEIWSQMYLASLEEAGLLRDEGQPAPIRENPLISSLMASLAAGILIGPAGNEFSTAESLSEFFEDLRLWYGHDEQVLAPLEGYLANGNPIPEIPTPMSRGEYVELAEAEASRLRLAILDDAMVSSTLFELADDQELWRQMFLGSLEEAGLLRVGEGDTSVLQEPSVAGLIATLSMGIAVGRGNQEHVTTGSLLELFENVYEWYGQDPDLPAEADGVFWNIDPNDPVPTLMTSDTHFLAYRVYVPWIPFEDRGAGLPADFQVSGAWLNGGEDFQPLDLSSYLRDAAASSGLASLIGPFTAETDGYLPVNEPLPYTVHFQNDPAAATHVGEVRVVIDLDDDLDASSFRLGDIRIGDIDIQMPTNRRLFQQDYDFTRTKGFTLRISVGIDQARGEATWLLQAIDPLTGEVMQDPGRGLLPPNNALGAGSGFVTYSVMPSADALTGTAITASARVLYNTAPPEDTQTIEQLVDAEPPSTDLTVVAMAGESNNYHVHWETTDDLGGSGVKHVTLYYAEDGGGYEIWESQVAESSAGRVFVGQPGHTYEFLALATDVAGNREQPPFDVNAPDDASGADLGALPNVGGTTPENYGIAPEPTTQPSTNPIFVQAELGVPVPQSAALPTEFDEILFPFVGEAFATGIAQSHGNIGPMAIVEAPDESILVSGGANRNEIWRLNKQGGQVGTPWTQLDHPIFNLVFDSQGKLWATTGGGPLLQLDPDTGAILHEFGDGLTIALAVEPQSDHIYVSSGSGVEIFNPQTLEFEHFSRDLNLRVGSLAFDSSGDLWATTWPDRSRVVRFNERRAPRRCWSSHRISTRSPLANRVRNCKICCSCRIMPDRGTMWVSVIRRPAD